MNGPERMIVFSWALALIVMAYAYYKKTLKDK
jgi:hypothetical protein